MTPEQSRIAINKFHNTGRILALMEKATEHHAIFTRRQVRALGGAALWLRGLPQMRIMMVASVHNELHANIEPVNFLPQEHSRRAFNGVYDIGLEYMGKLEAIDALARHMGVVSLRSSSSLQTQRVASNLEENLIAQRAYIIEGMV